MFSTHFQDELKAKQAALEKEERTSKANAHRVFALEQEAAKLRDELSVSRFSLLHSTAPNVVFPIAHGKRNERFLIQCALPLDPFQAMPPTPLCTPLLSRSSSCTVFILITNLRPFYPP